MNSTAEDLLTRDLLHDALPRRRSAEVHADLGIPLHRRADAGVTDQRWPSKWSKARPRQ